MDFGLKKPQTDEEKYKTLFRIKALEKAKQSRPTCGNESGLSRSAFVLSF